MKVSIDELKKAVVWLQGNSRDLDVQVYTHNGTQLIIKAMDKYENEVEITIYENGTLLPKIRKTEILR